MVAPAPADVSLRPIWGGCLFVVLGLAIFGGLIGFSLWQGIGQSKAIDTFTQPQRVPQPVEPMPAAAAAALDAELARFTASLDTAREDQLALDAARLNHLVARHPRLADLRGQLHVREVTTDRIVASICYPINPLPFERRERFLVGEVTLRPGLTDRGPALRVAGLGVPGKSLPDWFTRQFSLHHLLERHLADPGIRKRTAQLAAFEAEGGCLVLRSLPWVAR